MITSYVQIPEAQSSIYNCFTKEYLTRLFDMIKEYKAQDTDGTRTLENRFVKSEADVFDKVVTLLYNSLDGKTINEKDVYTILTETEGSVALYDTLIALAYGEEGNELREQLATIDDQIKETVRAEIEQYESNNSANERALTLAAAFRHVFGLE
jgi:hypothetical protein